MNYVSCRWTESQKLLKWLELDRDGNKWLAGWTHPMMFISVQRKKQRKPNTKPSTNCVCFCCYSLKYVFVLLICVQTNPKNIDHSGITPIGQETMAPPEPALLCCPSQDTGCNVTSITIITANSNTIGDNHTAHSRCCPIVYRYTSAH